MEIIEGTIKFEDLQKRIKNLNDNFSEFLRYCYQQFDIYNKKFFQSKLVPSIILIARDSKRRLGVYFQSQKRIGLNKRLIFSGVKQFNTTLVHEMCHQACHMIDNLHSEHHGYYWKQRMINCGLNPERTSNAQIYSDLELEQIKQQKEEQKKKKEEINKTNTPITVSELRDLINPYSNIEYIYGKFLNKENKWIFGLISRPNDRNGMKWIITSLNNSYIVPYQSFYKLNEEEKNLINKNLENYKRGVELVKKIYQQREERRQTRKIMKRRFGF